MRTIIVIFTERKVSPNEIPSYKKYKFLCNYDTVSLYDMVEDPRYTGKMMVVEFVWGSRFFARRVYVWS